jgi:hypothetical protein
MQANKIQQANNQEVNQSQENTIRYKTDLDSKSIQKQKRPIQAKQRPVQRMNGYKPHQAKHKPVQRNKAQTGDLKTKMGDQYGVDLSGFKEHQNSSFPSSVNALATIQGKDIHYAPGQFTEKNRKHELGHAIDNTLNGTPKGDKVVNGQSVDTTREKVADKIAEAPIQRKLEDHKEYLAPASNQANLPIQRTPDDGADLITWLIRMGFVVLGVFVLMIILRFRGRRVEVPKEKIKDLKKEEMGSDNSLSEATQKKVEEKIKQEAKPVKKGVGNIQLDSSNVIDKGNDEVKKEKQVEKEVIKEESKKDEELKNIDEEDKELKDEQVGNASSSAQAYLKNLRDTRMWGGYAEANAIARRSGFSSRIFTSNGGRLRLLANIGEGDRSHYNLLWTGNHYQVIAGNLSEGDNAPANPTHDPTGDGNCLFEAMYYIRANGARGVKRRLRNRQIREQRVQEMRDMAANELEQNDPVLLNYLGEEMQHARKTASKKNQDLISYWKNASGFKGVNRLDLYETLLFFVYKKYPPKTYYIDKSSKNPQFANRDEDKKEKHSIAMLLKDEEAEKILDEANEKDSKFNKSDERKNFMEWLSKEASYLKDVSKKQAKEKPKNFDEHSFAIADESGILDFLESKVSFSENLENCSKHLDGNEGRTTIQHEARAVYHYSRGKPSWGEQYTVFYIVLDDDFTYVKIVGVGGHVGKSNATYKLAWGIGGSFWSNGKEFSL